MRFWVVFQSVFSMISGFSIAVYIRIHYYFSTFFRVLASGPPSANFPPRLKPLVTPLQGMDLVSLRKFDAVKNTKHSKNQGC